MGGPFIEALRTIAGKPVLLISGAALGIFFSLGIVTQFYLGSFLAERLAFLWCLAIPFFLGGTYATILGGDGSLRTFLREGMRNYFRILLPVIIILFAAVLTLLLLSIPLGLLGVTAESGDVLFLVMGIGIPFLFLCYFTDAIAVLEGTGVFESIRRSIEFVFARFFSVLVFYLVTIFVAIPAVTVIGLVTEVVLFTRRPDLMEAFASGNVTALTPSEMTAALGSAGIWSFALTTVLVMIPVGSFLITYKVCFFQRNAKARPQYSGEYDEKGRWFRY